jgi:Carboxypeptidase regulatory-like domain/TonB dependent receptor-like, beta-barrel
MHARALSCKLSGPPTRSASFLKLYLLLVLLTLVCVGLLQAQVLYGTLTGNVTDASGAAIVGAKVEALNTATGVLRTATTDAAGAYRFDAVQPGPYKVTISASKFATSQTNNVEVVVNNIRRVDAQLKVASQSQEVTVTAEAPMLQTDKADVHTDITTAQIENLPLTSSVSGRNFQSLLRVVPGFGYLTEQNSAGGNPQRAMSTNVNGQSLQTINTRIDGAQDAYPWLPGNVAYVPPADAIETVNVVTNSFDPEQGMAGGAAVNVQIKSGTNQFHGTAHEFHTDQSLWTRNYFQTDPTRYPTLPRNNQNQFGGTFGGPIIKDKLFFFADWERTTQRQLAKGTATLPTADMRSGDFSALIPAGTDCNATPVAGCIYDPNNVVNGVRQAFPGNKIPSNRIDPAASKLLALMPPLTSSVSNPAGLVSDYVTKGTGAYNRDNYDFKVNWVPTEKSTFFTRYSLSRSHIFDPPSLGALGGDATAGGQLGNSDSRIQSVGLGGTYTFTNTILADWNFGFTRQRLGATALDIGTAYGLDTLQIPGTNGYGTNGDASLYNGIPAFQVATAANASSTQNMGNTNTGNPFLFRDNQFVWGANLSWNHTKHNLRFGVEFNHTQMNHFQPQGSDGNFTTARGSFGFNGDLTSSDGTPLNYPTDAWAQFMLGLANRAGKAIYSNNPDALRWSQWAWYARDQWQVTPALTLTLGVRWEIYPFGYSDNGKGLPVFNPADGNVYIGGLGNVPMDSNVNTGSGMFLPRFGLAYRLTSKTVIRGGYGMSADPNNYHFLRNAYPATITSDPVGSNGTNVAFVSLTGTNATGNLANVPVGITSILIPIPTVTSGVIPLPAGAGTRTWPMDFRRGYINSFNLTLQQEFAGFVAEAGYVGTRGIRPLTTVNLNAAQVCPATLPNGDARTSANCVADGYGRLLNTALGTNWAGISSMVPLGNNYYDSLQTKLTRRLKDGSQLGVVYTFSKAIDYAENEDLSGLFIQDPKYYSMNKALAGFDRPHNLQIYAVYNLPFGKGERWATSGVANKLAGGWQVSPILSRLSGTPFSVTAASSLLNPYNQDGLSETAQLTGPYRVLGNNPWSKSGSCSDNTCRYFDSSVLTSPTAGAFGNTSRNQFRGPGIFGIDLSLFRDFKVTERVTFQFQTNVFGLTNTPRFSNPNSTVGSTTFGAITSTLGTSSSNASTDGSRRIWFAGKLLF